MGVDMVTRDRCLELFVYKNGQLIWNKKKGRANVGDIVSNKVKIDGTAYGVHRIIFLMVHGYMPPEVDHKDNNPKNNNVGNLRAATRSQNGSNRRIQVNNTSGVKGVSLHRPSGLWRVTIKVNNKQLSCGYYKDLELAELVSIEARNKYHGAFANHN